MNPATDPMTFVVMVGFSTVRPIQPDQDFARVIVSAQDDIDATIAAAQIVACSRTVQMVTSTTITDFWI